MILTMLEELEKELKLLSEKSVIKSITHYAWEMLSKESTEDRFFATCSSWLSFMSIAKNTNSFLGNAAEKEHLLQLSNKTWIFLEKVIHPNYCKELIDPFVHYLECLTAEFSLYLELKAQKTGSKKPEKNYLRDLHLLSHEQRVEVFQTLTYASDLKNRNLETEIKYSCSPHVIAARSFLLASELDQQLRDKTSLQNFIKENLDFPSPLRFHQIFYFIFLLFLENKGVIEADRLATILENSKLITFSNQDKSSLLKEDILKLLELITITASDIEGAYAKLKDNISKKRTMLHDENPFYSKPVYKSLINENINFICPSPYILLLAMGNTFSSLFYKTVLKAFQQTKKSTKKRNLLMP